MIDITSEDLKKSYKQIKDELKNYSSKLTKKKELIVLNKTDLIDDKEVKMIKKDFSKITKSEVILLSTLEKKSVSKIKAKLISYVS
jgi:GTP-binding protein